MDLSSLESTVVISAEELGYQLRESSILEFLCGSVLMTYKGGIVGPEV